MGKFNASSSLLRARCGVSESKRMPLPGGLQGIPAQKAARNGIHKYRVGRVGWGGRLGGIKETMFEFTRTMAKRRKTDQRKLQYSWETGLQDLCATGRAEVTAT